MALVLAGAAIKLLPGTRTTRLLGRARADARSAPTQEDLAKARRIGFVVERVAGLLPWRAECLPQALAARWMLRRRGIGSEAHLGVTGTRPLDAHAWVTVGEVVVQGGPVDHATEVARFA